jgi:hypothetical protein
LAAQASLGIILNGYQSGYKLGISNLTLMHNKWAIARKIAEEIGNQGYFSQ